MPKIDEAVLRYDVYEDRAYLGIADIELPTFQPETVQINGSGIMGTYEANLLGQIQAMELNMNFRAMTTDTAKLTAPTVHNLSLWVSVQQADGSTRAQSIASVRYVVQCEPKNVNEGTLTPGSTQSGKATYSVKYFAKYVDGELVTEVDPLNSVLIWDGVDYYAPVRAALGL